MDITHHNEHTDVAGSAHTPDSLQVRVATHLLTLGIGSGLLLHGLVWDRIGGSLGMLIWTVLSCAAALWLNRKESARWRRELLIWTSVISCAAGFAVLRDADEVMLLMYLVMVLCLGMVFYRSGGESLGNATLPLVLAAAVRLPARIMLGLFPALDTVIKSKWHGGSQLGAVFRGLLIATPLVFVFVMLFSSADALFSQQLARIARFMGELTPSTPLISLLLIVLATGLLSCSLMQNTAHLTAQRQTQADSLWPGLNIRLGSTETAIALGSLVLLFVTFVLLQASYLFGGRELIEARSGLTLAAYARRGFFELLTVAALTLGVLMAFASTHCPPTLFRRMGGVLIACVMVMLMSALYRLNLYIEQFGLTMARLVALAVMLWLIMGLLLFAATVLRGNVRGFLAGLTISSIACCLLLAAINPAARVAQVNIQHAQTGSAPLDILYLNSLGADVVPVLLTSLSESSTPAFRCFADFYIQSRWQPPSADWRDWNAARAAAYQAIIDARERC